MRALATRARAVGLAIRGALPPRQGDPVPDDTRAIALLGPDEPNFWARFTAAKEYRDGQPDPLDRWSKRVIGELAHAEGATAIFPSDGPPYAPFMAWALDSGQAWTSPVGPLVHADAGLFISFRAALALPRDIDLPQPATQPCPTCARPCATACPVDALSDAQPYDVAACQAHLASDQGSDCRLNGCLVRRACPTADSFTRLPEQSGFHMSAFIKAYRS
ncbi:hypothetical protein [Tropicibacter naphthalenivorans]|uniref:4Fe-4S ferredoxin-type domain-containing protein n=1 Tax=Tropicibacter naphthalenivorans TaxID=441103 RepID=A0A0P1GY87_9RHOB|nr:hypothetical protein [Tropicibacter naphthalenivorans]CUH78807.1 hypothetical protein TRN7648_02179 [Tropicibacter naphthalenivorans]SMC81615.1 hypothetical protein SAMN04488093_104341 [Tropicibacter naphthalenivorans]